MATYTVSQDGTGADYSVAQHNADAMSLSAGDTISIIGTIAGTTSLIVPASGSSGSPITYTGGNIALEGSIGTDGGRGIRAVARDYIEFDGIAFANPSEGIYITGGGAGIKITNCTFSDDRRAIFATGLVTKFLDAIEISYCTFTDVGIWTDTTAADINITEFAINTHCHHNTHRAVTTNRGVDGVTFSMTDLGNPASDPKGAGHVIEYCSFDGAYEENGVDFKGCEQYDTEGWNIVRNCTFTNGSLTKTEWIHTHFNCNRVLIENNTFDTGEGAIANVASDADQDARFGDIKIIGNTIKNMDKYSIWMLCTTGAGTGNITIANNIFDSCSAGSDQYSIRCNQLNFYFFNNIVSNQSLSKATGIPIELPANGAGTVWANANFQGNKYYLMDGRSLSAFVRDSENSSTKYSAQMIAAGFEAQDAPTIDPETDFQLDANDVPLSTSPCVGKGTKWWGATPNPVGLDGEPFADYETDIGAIQSKHSKFHPTNI